MATKKKTPASKSKAKAKSVTRAPARKKTAAKKAKSSLRPPPRTKTAAARKKAPRAPAPPPPPKLAENPKARELARRIGDLLLDKKASDVVILDMRGMTSYADYIVIASGESDRQVSAMAENVQVQLKQGAQPLRPISTEGLETGQWVLLDYDDVVAHLFNGEVRAFYDLDGLWADAPRVKLA
ncbi:ribosome silencing factor [Corallococcus llansteffanensis]|uniref:ribosome silencing factor n=1 Tax=Corallococcus llansteffanensis TaxID=2316731 RepID=UPI001ABF2197|nr:ribosome silencing factor [Corallococcus llansteffanensis]